MLTGNRRKERANAVNLDRLNKNSFNQEIATNGIDLKYSGTGMIEVAEREKTKILKKYAEERRSLNRSVTNKANRK